VLLLLDWLSLRMAPPPMSANDLFPLPPMLRSFLTPGCPRLFYCLRVRERAICKKTFFLPVPLLPAVKHDGANLFLSFPKTYVFPSPRPGLTWTAVSSGPLVNPLLPAHSLCFSFLQRFKEKTPLDPGLLAFEPCSLVSGIITVRSYPPGNPP